MIIFEIHKGNEQGGLAWKIQKAVLTETKHITIGVLIGDAVMCGVFAALKKFDYTVPLGALLGTVFAVGGFFLLGMSIQAALGKGEGAQKFMRATYTGRMLLYGLCLVLGAIIPCFNAVATAVPLLLPQLVIYAMRALGLYKPEKAAPAPGEETKKERDEA